MVGDASPCYRCVKLNLDLGSWHAVRLLCWMTCTFDGEKRILMHFEAEAEGRTVNPEQNRLHTATETAHRLQLKFAWQVRLYKREKPEIVMCMHSALFAEHTLNV